MRKKEFRLLPSFRIPAAALIPCAVVLLAMRIEGVYPIGGNSMLFVDSATQYIAFLASLRHIIVGGREPSLFSFQGLRG